MTYRFTSANLPQLTSWVGFDRLWDELEKTTGTAKAVGYPPYNIKKITDNQYCIEMAVAGFGKTDINITTEGDQLVISGGIKSDPWANYVHKGIAERAFERSFTLADTVIVKNASMINGMLKIFLEQIIPEEKKPKVVPIGDTDEIQNVTDKQLLTE